MNSKQRRQLNRKTKYKVTINRSSSESWLDYDDRAEKAVTWVKRHCKGEYYIINRFQDATFKFQKESDAVHFGLLFI